MYLYGNQNDNLGEAYIGTVTKKDTSWLTLVVTKKMILDDHCWYGNQPCTGMVTKMIILDDDS